MRLRAGFLAGLAAMTLWGAGCARPVAPLRVGLVVWPAYELPFLARAGGYLDPARVELVDFRSPAEAQRAYEQGLLDAVALTLGYAIQVSSRDPSNRIVFVIDYSDGGDALVARGDIATVAHLRGRPVALEASALGLHLLMRALEPAGLTLDDVDLVPVDVADHVTAFAGDSLAAIVTYDPARARLLTDGAHQLFSSRDIPGEIVDVLMARRGVVDTRRAQLEHLVAAWGRARAEYRRTPRSAAAVMSARQGVAPETFMASMAGLVLVDAEQNRRLLTGADPTLIRTARRLHALLADRGLLDRDEPLPAAFLDARVVETLP